PLPACELYNQGPGARESGRGARGIERRGGPRSTKNFVDQLRQTFPDSAITMAITSHRDRGSSSPS
ncbi:MAG: hypothetical protein ACNA8W_22135, partial [Bradymonadaceae bacterium]